jgi:hypothetical protein
MTNLHLVPLIVSGVDGSTLAMAALGFAIREEHSPRLVLMA